MTTLFQRRCILPSKTAKKGTSVKKPTGKVTPKVAKKLTSTAKPMVKSASAKPVVKTAVKPVEKKADKKNIIYLKIILLLFIASFIFSYTKNEDWKKMVLVLKTEKRYEEKTPHPPQGPSKQVQ